MAYRKGKPKRDRSFGLEKVVFIVKATNPKAKRKKDSTAEFEFESETAAIIAIRELGSNWKCRLFRRVEYEIRLIESPDALRRADFG